MKKLSFLELEKEMERLSMEEASRTKGGGNPPRDCAFHAFHYIMADMYGYRGQSEQQLEQYYNDYWDPDSEDGLDPMDKADIFGLEDIDDQGLDWMNACLSNHYDNGSANFTASYISGDSSIPNTTNPGESDQYMVVVDTGDDYHAVVFRGTNSEGDYICADPQQGKMVQYSPDEVEGVVAVHKQVSTTLPTTTIPMTSEPTTTI